MKIGRYTILEKVGEGGCGVVYVAQRTEPVRRRVALKVIKPGMDTKAVVARFVMELVRGIKITDHCDQEKVSTRERLDLFIKVCQAIQHAHQKGIIHRDIRPSRSTRR